MIRKLFVTFLLFVLILAAGFFSSLYLKRALDTYFNRKTVVVPDFVGQSLSAAIHIQKTHDGNLKIDISNEVESTTVPRDTVVSQDPQAGSLVNAEKTISLTISRGAHLREVPDLVGQDVRRARLVLSEARMRVGKKAYIRTPDRERGVIVLQYPEGKSQAGQGESVDLLMSDSPGDGEPMPRVTFLQLSEAREVLKELQITKIDVEEVNSPNLPAELVVAQEPPAGTPAPQNGACRLMVAKAGTSSMPVSSAAAANKRKVWVQFEMPPGLTEKLLEIEVSDNVATQKVHSKVHAPGEIVKVEVQGEGSILVRYYLDQNPTPVLEQQY